MSRYDFDPEDYRAPRSPAKEQLGRKTENTKQENGRGSSGGGEQPKSKSRPDRASSRERGNRRPRQDRDREYNLRESEIATLITIAKFRSVRTADLVEIQYKGDNVRATQDLRNLTAQGLIQRRTRAGTEKDQLVTVTRSAQCVSGPQPAPETCRQSIPASRLRQAS